MSHASYHKVEIFAPDEMLIYRIFTYIRDRLNKDADFSYHSSDRNGTQASENGQPVVRRIFGAAAKNSKDDKRGVLAASFELALKGVVMTLRSEGFSVQLNGDKTAKDKQVDQRMVITRTAPTPIRGGTTLEAV
jgi:hypothetical protein